MSNYQHIQEEAFLANCQLPELGLVMFTFGNVSAADHSLGVFAIKPSGVPYNLLKPSDMVIVDFDGKIVKGKLRPSSDTKTHAVLYKHWNKISGIAHTHSCYATAWAQSQQDIPVFGTTHADHTVSDIVCAPPMDDDRISGDYEYETGLQIIETFNQRKLDYSHTEMILLSNHAPFTWGKTAGQAVYNSAVLEYIAKMAVITRQVKTDAPRLKETLIKNILNASTARMLTMGRIHYDRSENI